MRPGAVGPIESVVPAHPEALTPESLRDIGSADVPGSVQQIARFNTPPPTPTLRPSGTTGAMPDVQMTPTPTPFATSTGVVMDPGLLPKTPASRWYPTNKEEYLEVNPIPKPRWYPGNEEEWVRTHPPGAPPRDTSIPTVQEAWNMLRDRYAKFDPSTETWQYTIPEQEMYQMAQRMARGEELQRNPIGGASPYVMGPGEVPLPAIGRIVAQGMSPTPAATPTVPAPTGGPPISRAPDAGIAPAPARGPFPAPSATTPPAPFGIPPAGNDLRAQARAIRQAHPDWTPDQVKAELRKQAGSR